MGEALFKFLLSGLTREQARGALKFSWRAVLVFHILFACGWLSTMGLGHGFAFADDVTRLADSQREVQVQLLENAIVDTRIRQCKSPNDEARRLYSEKLQEYLRRYFGLTRQGYNLPSCNEL